MGNGQPVQPSNFSSHRLKGVLCVFIGGLLVVEHLDKGPSGKMSNDQPSSGEVHVQQRRNVHAVFSQTNQQPRFADHSSYAQAMIEMWMPPCTLPSLLAYGALAEPFARPNFSFCPQVQPVLGVKHHG